MESFAQDASNLSELYLTLGDVNSAQKYGAQSVTFADRSGDDDRKEASRCNIADANHQAGKISEAEKLFMEAENMQKKRQPKYPYLYSLRGFQFCDLLLSMGKVQQALERARTTVEYENEGWYSLLDIALDKLTIGKALMLQAIDNNSTDPSASLRAGLNQAVNDLRESGNQDDLPRGLLARAALYNHQKDFLKSWTDLDEAREIAAYGQMKLHLADYHLEACRNIEKQLSEFSGQPSLKDYQIMENGDTLSLTKEEMQAKFQYHFKEAARLIKVTGYHRRDGELDELMNNTE